MPAVTITTCVELRALSGCASIDNVNGGQDSQDKRLDKRSK